MRIGMILDTKFPPDYRVEKEALTLTANENEVVLFCLGQTSFHEEKHKGFLLARYPTNTFEYKMSALAYTIPVYHWLMGRKIDDFVKRYKPDVLHVHDMVVAEAALTVAKKRHIRVVLDLHENRPASMREYRHLNKAPGKWLIDLNRWERKQNELVKRSDAVVVVTELAKQDLVKQTGKSESSIVVVPNTSADSFRQFTIDEQIIGRMKDTFNILYIGDTSVRRGTADAVLMIDVLKAKIPNVKLWMIGTSSFDPALHKLVSERGLENYIQFEGWQPEKFFASYITGAHICVSPLKRNPHHDTTYANKIFQYMSMQRPLLVSDCPAQANLVTDEGCGLVHKAGDVEDMARQTMYLYENPELRIEMGTRAKVAVVKKWNWEKTTVPLVELYHTLAMS
jgi:glycosyltransferase involved in cell wall biosynthesis